MPHNSSPLAIIRHRFHSFECIATDGPITDGALSLTTKPELSHSEDDPSLWQVTLLVEFAPEDKEKPSTYCGHMKIHGEFRIDESFKEENCEALIRVTAVSILYGSCREMLANFTARSLHGELSLPSISFRKHSEAADDE